MKCRCSNCGWLEVNPSGAMFCGYSDERTWEDESCLAWKDKDWPQTNADRIREMSDEELAEWLSKFTDCGECPVDAYPNCTQSEIACSLAWERWLKQEVEE